MERAPTERLTDSDVFTSESSVSLLHEHATSVSKVMCVYLCVCGVGVGVGGFHVNPHGNSLTVSQTEVHQMFSVQV